MLVSWVISSLTQRTAPLSFNEPKLARPSEWRGLLHGQAWNWPPFNVLIQHNRGHAFSSGVFCGLKNWYQSHAPHSSKKMPSLLCLGLVAPSCPAGHSSCSSLLCLLPAVLTAYLDVQQKPVLMVSGFPDLQGPPNYRFLQWQSIFKGAWAQHMEHTAATTSGSQHPARTPAATDLRCYDLPG